MTHTLYNEDCLTRLKLIPSDSVDCIVTSPPYNKPKISLTKNSTWSKRNIEYESYDDCMDEDAYQRWQGDILNECYRVLKPTGSLFYNHKLRRAKSRTIHPLSFVLKSRLHLYQEITWDRNATPNRSKYFLTPTTEQIYWLVKDKPAFYKTAATHTSEVWRIDIDRGNSHPAPFPLDIPINCILLTTKEGDTVLDPFAGSGTTLLAAKQLNRNSIGIEMSKQYCDLIEERMK